jgi:hypothetical protein
MTRRRRILPDAISIIFLLAAAAACSSCATDYRSRLKSSMKETGHLDRARLDQIDGLPVLHLYGTHREMGAQYGALLKQPLQCLHGYLRQSMPKERVDRMLAFASEHEKCMPVELREELRAAADAADVPYKELLALNLIPEMSCSMLAVRGAGSSDGRMIVGRNLDYSALGLDDCAGLVVVYHPDEGTALASVSFLGIAGAFTGMNSKGVCFGNMLVFNAAEKGRRRDGQPVQALLRMAAHRNANAPQMIDILRSQKHFMPMNVMAADAKEALVVELGLNGSEVRDEGQGSGLVSSNDFRTALAGSAASCPRYDALMLRACGGMIDAPAMQSALYEARIDGLNIQAVVFEPEKMLMRVSINRVPASAGPYKTLDLKALFANERPSQTAP